MCGTVKVADFGLSEDMYSTNYFRQGKSSVDAVETKVPIRWMPLESIEEGLYNEKSDVVRALVRKSIQQFATLVPRVFYRHMCTGTDTIGTTLLFASSEIRKLEHSPSTVLLCSLNIQWSYGVTVWEIFTCGKVPYHGISCMALPGLLRAGEHLEKPYNTACSDDM